MDKKEIFFLPSLKKESQVRKPGGRKREKEVRRKMEEIQNPGNLERGKVKFKIKGKVYTKKR